MHEAAVRYHSHNTIPCNVWSCMCKVQVDQDQHSFKSATVHGLKESSSATIVQSDRAM